MVWVSRGSLNTAREGLAGGGNSENAICMGGYSGVMSAVTEEFNGSAWSVGGNLGTARTGLAGSGNSSEAICFGGFGYDFIYYATTEEYNGTGWSTGGDLATARKYLSGGGNSANAIAIGGFYYEEEPEEVLISYDATEEYNGTAWSSGGNLATARYYSAGGGNSSDAICMGGRLLRWI
jgi:hypothetical protein